MYKRQTKNAADYDRTKGDNPVIGYTYDPDNANAINTISWTEGEAPTGIVLKLYYNIHQEGFKVEHYFQGLDGNFVKASNDDTGTIIFGQTKNASDFVRTEAGFTYDPSNENAINAITYNAEPFTDNTLKLYYTRNQQEFAV